MITFVKNISEMKVHELLDLNKNLLILMKDNGLTVADVKYLAMYKEFEKLREEGVKVCYIARAMADEYGITESHVYRIVRSFNRLVKL